jgi:hypothetical protein
MSLFDALTPVVSAATLRRVTSGAAICALCREAVRPDDDVVLTPDFLANDNDPLWRFTDAVLHRPCFLVWDLRKTFVARHNQLARQLVADDGSYPFMTSEGDIVQRKGGRPPTRGPVA